LAYDSTNGGRGWPYLLAIKMKNLLFVIWMLCWPLDNGFSDYLAWITYHQTYSGNVHAIGVLTMAAVWVWVGAMLYE